jgi:hypothetical protein
MRELGSAGLRGAYKSARPLNLIRIMPAEGICDTPSRLPSGDGFFFSATQLPQPRNF